MNREKAFELLNKGVLKKGCKVRMSDVRGFENFVQVDDAYVKKARQGELEDDYVVVVVDNVIYDCVWVDEVLQ